MKINPILDYIIVQELEQPKSVLILDDVKSILSPATYGHVIAAGPGRCDLGGQLIPNSVKADDKVVFQRNFGTPLCISGRDIWVLRESQIIAILTEEENEMPGITAEITVNGKTYPVPSHVADEVARMIQPYAAKATEKDTAAKVPETVVVPPPETAQPTEVEKEPESNTADDEEVAETASDDSPEMAPDGEPADGDSPSEPPTVTE